ncbi:MAG: putative peptidoglycan glycosyltransferase FtsW [Myxococcota bacterium]
MNQDGAVQPVSSRSFPSLSHPRLGAGTAVVVLAVAAVTLAGFGLVIIQSATAMRAAYQYGYSGHFVVRQAAGLGLGLVASLLLVRAPAGTLRRLAGPAYLATLGLLLLVATPLGHTAGGATRWLALGPIHLQPSEIAKLTVIGVLADYLAHYRDRVNELVGIALPGVGLVLPAVALVIVQRDFGTTAILLALVGVLFILAGLRWRWVLAFASGVGGALLVLVAIEPYRLQRVLGFVDPFADASGTGFQVVQSWIALAAGGPTGVGLANGVVQRGFLPEVHNDFILAVVGEELGAVGIAAVVALQLALVAASFAIARRAGSSFGCWVAGGIATLFAIQATINIGVVGGVFPTKGLVLPFVSYGASAAAVHAFAVGVLVRIGTRVGRD